MGQFEEMETFLRIVDAGSISRAAQQLGMVKSAISRRLSDLETRLGVQLLARTTRTSSLTDAGQRYYAHATRMVAEMAEINADIADAKNTLSGVLKASAPLNFGIKYLRPIISDFAKAHPAITIQMDFNDRQVDLVNEGYDLAIRIANLKDSSLKARKLFEISMMICASPAYLTAHGTPRSVAELKALKALHYGNAASRTWRLTAPDGSASSVQLDTKMSSNNGEFLCHAAIEGHGVIQSPSFIVWDALKVGKLVPLLPDYQLDPIAAYTVYPETRHLPERVRRLIEELQSRLKNEPFWHAPIPQAAPTGL